MPSRNGGSMIFFFDLVISIFQTGIFQSRYNNTKSVELKQHTHTHTRLKAKTNKEDDHTVRYRHHAELNTDEEEQTHNNNATV